MTQTIKEILKEFVGILEAVIINGAPYSPGPFEAAVPAKILAQAEVALCQAKATDEQVILLTNGTSARALIAAFILQETGLTAADILADFSERTVDPVVKCLLGLKESRLLLLEASSIALPTPGASNTRYILLSAN